MYKKNLEVRDMWCLVSLLVIFRESPFVVVFEGRAKQGSGRMAGSVSVQIPEARIREQPKGFPIEYVAEGIGLDKDP